MSIEKWPTLGALPQPDDFEPESALEKQPFIPGIYCLWALDGSLVYIGQSANIGGRLSTHRREGKKRFHHATFWRCADYSRRLQIESILILASKPPSNRAVTVGLARNGRLWDTTQRHFQAIAPRSRRGAAKKEHRRAR